MGQTGLSDLENDLLNNSISPSLYKKIKKSYHAVFEKIAKK